MLPYQEKYVNNAREIFELMSANGGADDGFRAWLEQRRAGLSRMEALRRENVELLNAFLFPSLDGLHSADAETLSALEAFADALLDWRTNLDCGVYIVIHDALLSFHRVRRDRNQVIKELYKLGMGLYYQRRMVTGTDCPQARALHFENEMVFTEAAAYMRYYDDIDDEATRGFIIRALANIAICAEDSHRKIAASARTLRIVRDPHFRELAPGLPWDGFLRKTHQQMSSNRSVFSKGNLSGEELAEVLDSCYEVFKPEEGVENPSIRWLWPYYEMEFSLGYVDLETTLKRLETLIERTPWNAYDISGMYGNVQLAIYYGRLMRDYPQLRREPARVAFLDRAYRKMARTLLTFPADQFGDYMLYNFLLVYSDYFEMEGVPSYREVTTRLMQRFAGELYVRSRRAGAMMRRLCEALLKRDAHFFDELPILEGVEDGAARQKALLDYAEDCGLYCDFGMMKVNVERILRTRNLFESEYQIFQLHTISGHDDLAARASTAMFADVALGHHSWYAGPGGYPERYVRTASPWRLMTDVAVVVSFMLDEWDGDMDALVRKVIDAERSRFSPLVTACLNDPEVCKALRREMAGDGEAYYDTIYRELFETGE